VQVKQLIAQVTQVAVIVFRSIQGEASSSDFLFHNAPIFPTRAPNEYSRIAEASRVPGLKG